MSDPAFEAANRAMKHMIGTCGDPGRELGQVMYDLAVSAAREALTPVRELIEMREEFGDELDVDDVKEVAFCSLDKYRPLPSCLHVEDNPNDHRYHDQPAMVRLPYPDDTHNGLTNSPMMGWEPVRGLPYYIELVPKGSIEIEHDGKRLTPTNAAGAREIAVAFLSAAHEADEQ